MEAAFSLAEASTTKRSLLVMGSFRRARSKRPLEADSCRSEYPASSTRHRSTTTPGAAGPCARMINSTRFAARSSILGPMPSWARSITTASTSPCATTVPNAERRRDERIASTRSRVGAVLRASPRGTRGSARIGHFGYGHIDALVQAGDTVVAGQHIGWTCRGDWHLHLSEFIFTSGRSAGRQSLCARVESWSPTRTALDPRFTRFASTRLPLRRGRGVRRRASRAFHRPESAMPVSVCSGVSTCASG